MRLLLIRHGRTASNVTRLLDTAPPGAPLDDVGLDQARALADTLADEPIEAVYASDLIRSQQTAEPLALRHGLEVIVRAGVREIQAGEDEMSADWVRYLTTIISWQSNIDTRIPGGETGREVLARFDAVLGEARAKGHRTIAVVSHGAMIRTWAATRATNLTVDFLRTTSLENTLVVDLADAADGSWQVTRWGDKTP
ncbi:MAG: histidine phosphatase family protein [Actinomycetales bacterium]|nr:histidine phosphatase family protein [Candidatus Phosphoribacter baldrii]MBK6954047.1 histidine phosphatase family protein [Candidatus Phosphoribacter baldrii]